MMEEEGGNTFLFLYMDKKVELLAPAGDMEALKAAVFYGADAVYLAGDRFGARAYAGNFSRDELLWALDYAHINDRKIYLTLNTLIKESEFGDALEYVRPFYENGLDGIIVQDIGLLSALRAEYPMLELHASTQMSIASSKGAELLKGMGVSRVVPARELSIDEIKQIKNKTGLEIECFIHGAMCYGYSGQCLFSSMLGDRSGNRGRCAGPCRLPYSIISPEGKELLRDGYPLSLKDMCTISIIDELIDAGIDSFKIEGRMKSEAFVGGTVLAYRRAIDSHFGARIRFDKESEEKRLSHLYIRSSLCEGYYHKHNGKDMITLQSPSYATVDSQYADEITEGIELIKKPVEIYVSAFIGEPLSITVCNEVTSVTVNGAIVQSAQNNPTTVDMIQKQVSKLGDSLFVATDIFVELDSNPVFVRVKEINELRREAINKLSDEILKPYRKTVLERENEYLKNDIKTQDKQKEIFIHIEQEEQANIKLPEDSEYIFRLCVPLEIISNISLNMGNSVILVLPDMIRERNIDVITKAISKCNMESLYGIMARTADSLRIAVELKKTYKSLRIIADSTLYSYNSASLHFYKTNGVEAFIAPLELTSKETGQIYVENDLGDIIFPVFGRTRMMVSAGCVKKTMGCCDNRPEYTYKLKDRTGQLLPVFTNCFLCENKIYNSHTTVIFSAISKLKRIGYKNYYLHFTVENNKQINKAVEMLLMALKSDKAYSPEDIRREFGEYTTGHFKNPIL